ncbi:MAG: GntR family transcriptional regulator [Streptosporangiaceae bacterium]
MASTVGKTGPERSGDAATPLRRMPLYAQAEKVLEDLLVHRQYRIGDRIPPEAELVRSLGVSRATIRAAVGRLAGRGLLVRRQGSGTFLARLPEQVGQPSPVGIKLGSNVAQLGRLETYTSIAERLGLKAESDQLRVEAARSAPDEAGALELPATSEVIRVSRVLRFDGETAAWMIDVLPADLMSAGTLRERLTPHQMVLDVLLDAGIPVAFSEVEISTALLDPGQPAGRSLGLGQPTAALMMTETMYLDSAVSAEGRPVQWSRNYFLPGKLSLRLVRDMPANRDPAIVLQLLTDT